jgi:hypothetical protein
MLSEAGCDGCQTGSEYFQSNNAYDNSVSMESVLCLPDEKSGSAFRAVGFSLKDTLKEHL